MKKSTHAHVAYKRERERERVRGYNVHIHKKNLRELGDANITHTLIASQVAQQSTSLGHHFLNSHTHASVINANY